MFRLIKLLISLVVLAGFTYFAVAVPLGDKTLWQHVKAIAGSKASKDLVDGVKEKAGEVVKGVGSAKGTGAKKSGEKKSGEKKGDPIDNMSDEERRALRKLIKDRLAGKATDGSAQKKE